MNNSINYSGYIEMVLDSTDEFEPYGVDDLGLDTQLAGPYFNRNLHRDSFEDGYD